jgi:hypothetical protein
MTDAHLPTGPDGEPLTIVEDGDTGDRFLVYTSKDGLRAELRILGDTFWATRAQMAEMFDIDARTISYHLTNIFADGELDADSVSQDSWLTAADGKRYRTNLYSLDAMISVGYRVSSRLGTMFRVWATAVLMQYLTKGFVIDDRRLKNPDGKPDFFEELLERIRDIRSSEKRMWTRILELASFCVDYDGRDVTQHTEFFAEIQNTMHWAVLQKTASEVVMSRVDHRKENAGVQTFDGKIPTVAEAQTAKNLMMEPEVTALNHITSLMLEFFDSQAEQRRLTTLGEFQVKLRELVKLDGRPLKPMSHAGKVSRARADEWAAKEIKTYKANKRLEAEDAGERELRKIAAAAKSLSRQRQTR